MIFKKISILALLVLCTICTSESCHHSKFETCGCSQKTEPTAETNHNKRPDKIDGRQDIMPKDQSIKKQKLNSSGVSKTSKYLSTIPIQNNRLNSALDKNIQLNPTNNISKQRTGYLNVDPYITEALLKQLWLFYQLHHVQEQNPNLEINENNIEIQQESKPLPSQIVQHEDYFKIPHINILNKLDKQRSTKATDSRFLSESLLKYHFDKDYKKDDSKAERNSDNEAYFDYIDVDDAYDEVDSNDDANHNEDNDTNITNDNNIVYNENDDDDADYDEYQNVDKTIYDSNQNSHKIKNMPMKSSHGKFLHYYKKQANKPLSVIPLPEYYFDKQQGSIPKYPHVATHKNNVYNNVDMNIFAKHRNTYPTSSKMYKFKAPKKYESKVISRQQKDRVPPQTNVNSDIYLPFKYDSKTISDVTDRNFDDNIPYQQDSNNMFNEQRYYKPAIQIAHSTMPSVKHAPGKFSEWIFQQINLLNSRNQGADKLDFDGLGNSVIQILRNNGMHITDNGMLMDTHGTVSNIHSLSLTPIIIGNTMSLGHLFKRKYEAISSKLQTPGLQAILLSATQPPKILGIMPLGTTNLPPKTLNSITNMLSSITKDLESEQNSKNKIINEKKTKQNNSKEANYNTRLSDHDYVQNRYPGQSSHYVNINGINNSHQRPYFSKILSSRRGIGPQDDTDDDRPYSKKSINQELESNGGRLFIPRIEIGETPIIDIYTRRKNLPVKFVASQYYEPSRVHIPSISSFLDIAFGRHNTPVEDDITTQNSINAEISNSPVAVSGAEKLSDLKALKMMSLLDKDVSASVKEEMVLQQDFHDIPHDVSIVQKIENIDIGSRSGVDTSELPPENDHDGNSAFDLVENDDDDGDFRIIGGNAATGSGTPLSNKGRSGYVI